MEGKIAICFSGQIRDSSYCAPNILRYIGDLLPKCDFFIHTWDVESLGTGYACRTHSENVINPIFSKVNVSDINKFSDVFSAYIPRTMQVEEYNLQPSKELWGGRRYDPVTDKWYVSMWRSIYESNKLKLDYSTKNGFKYEYTVRMRMDIVFSPEARLLDDILKITNKNMILFADPWNIWEKHGNTRIEDVMFIGNSDCMDRISEYYTYYTDSVANIDDPNDQSYRDWQYHSANWIVNILKIDICPMMNNKLRIWNAIDIQENISPMDPGFGDPPGAFRFKPYPKIDIILPPIVSIPKFPIRSFYKRK